MKNIKTYEEFKGMTFKEFLSNNLELDINNLFLNCNSENLIDLNGIDIFKNLTELDLSLNFLTSLKGIEKSTKLQELYCWYNKITSLDGIENLINLTYLDCEKNLITSLDSIQNLINLDYINCDDNNLTSLKGIENLTKLENLYCQINTIDWVDYIDKKGNIWYTTLPKSITKLRSDKFYNINEYWKFMDQNQPVGVSRKFNF